LIFNNIACFEAIETLFFTNIILIFIICHLIFIIFVRDRFTVFATVGLVQQHIYEMAGIVQNRNFVHQRKLSAKKKNRFSKVATS
jgi:hypothetical protein